MADRKPVKVLPDGGGDSTGLGEFVAADTVGVADGGTGAVTAGAALTALGASPTAGNSSLTTLGTIGTGVWQGTDVGIAHGGTGASTAGAALTALGASPTAGSSSLTTLGTIGTGVWQGTDVGIAHGGTGASTASAARTALGVADLTVSSTLTGKDIAAKTSENISKVILVDLTDPGTMWDVQAFLTASRFMSWRVELGAPPMRGAIWINNDKSEIKWWNLDTDAVYMTFEDDAADMVPANPTDISFLDGILYIADSTVGVAIIDFLGDRRSLWQTGGEYRYKGDIKERNDGDGNELVRTSPAIKSNVCNWIAAARSTDRHDVFGRPVHFWSVGTSTGASLYNPYYDAIYDWHDDNRASGPQLLMGDHWFFMRDQGTYEGVNWIRMAMTSDNLAVIQHFNPWDSASNTNTNGGHFPWAKAATVNGITGGSGGSGGSGGEWVLVSSDEGLCCINLPLSQQSAEVGWIWTTSTYQTPYMKGQRKGAYPLNDVNDKSGNGKTLTNSNSTTFTSGPFGNTATFNGTNQSLYDADDAHWAVPAGTSITVSFYFKSTTATNPSADESLVFLVPASVAAYYQTSIMSSGGRLQSEVRNNSIENESVNAPGDYCDAKWHHVVSTYKVGRGLELWADGVKIAEETNTTYENAASSYTDLWVGSIEGGQYFDGQIAQLSICHSAWTETEITFEYQRMVRGVGGATVLLGATDVDSISTDPQTGLTAVCANNQVEIWNNFCMRESIDAVTTATLNDADVRLPVGADDPLYIAGRHAQFEVVAPDRRVLD